MDDHHSKKRKDIFDGFFDDFESEFENMRKYMDRMFEHALSMRKDESFGSRPFVYGFSVRIGPDGIPHIQEFGNTRRSLINLDKHAEGFGREPLTDVIENDNSVTITAELPGVEKDDVELEIKGKVLEINVDSKNRKYFKKIDLPDNIDPDSISATYKNGVLDININKRVPKEKATKKIKIE